jgi:plastocyanin
MKFLEEHTKNQLFVNKKSARRVRNRWPTLLLALCLGMSNSWVWGNSNPYSISIEGFSPYYTPQRAIVTSGIPIIWENPTATHHTITHDGCGKDGTCAFDSGAIRPHGTFEIAGLSPGHYPYHCTLHPIMRGVVEVGDPLVFSST